MTDSINANVVVSMPSQLFTMARSFKAVANGKIYIGKIDTDPVNPENQIQVYVENEDGSHVPVSQPIIINAAGYPVYNGQIAKFVTVQGHSMAVYDAYGSQQFYYPNVLKYDPDQLRQELAGPDGYLLIPSMPIHIQMQKWRDDGDIRGWGCVCDGVADDSDNFQAAITATEAADKPLFIPGPVRITKKLTFTKPPQMRGYKYSPPVIGSFGGVPYAKKGCIIYSEVASGPCIDINPASNNQYIRGLGVIDVHVLARGAGVTGTGVRIANCGWGGYVRGLVVEGFPNGGLELSQVQDTLFDQLEVLSCGTDNVVAALEIKNGSNLLAFNRIRLEANAFQMRIRNSGMIDFVASHFEQGDYPGASQGAEFEKINQYPSIVLQASNNIKFTGGFMFGATIQKQMSKFSIPASSCAFHMTVGSDCTGIDFVNMTLGFGYNSGRILEHHGSGSVQSCTLLALCTETYPLILDGNILFKNNNVSYTDNPTSDTFYLMAAYYATIEGNLFGCLNSSSANKIYGSLYAVDSGKPILLGRNQYIISKRARVHDGRVNVINQSHDGSEQSAGGAVNMQQYLPTSIINLFGGSGGASTVTSIDNMSPNQKVTFCNNGTGNITINHGGNIGCKGGVNAVVPAGCFIEFMYNGNTGVSQEIARSF
ncbi:phage head-binding domain-containing protein [Escherichia coli]